ncbi:MAG: hydantoinase B/oxoprolinase family protein [Deltaproteobacteria bacterium]|nr:hydantoinase B/oxoprolinase family protein [Deltaproteobacteria bacterium]
MLVSSSVDPVTFEILSHRLHQITLEMGTTLERVGGTVNTTQMHDYMAALYLPNGDVLSAGESMARHAACAGFAVKRIVERFERNGGIYPDDVFLLNDPYLAAIHQSDIYMVSPIHYRNQLMGWSATFVHVMDIGAMSPGGNSPGATEICHEGLRIPGLKLVEGGKLRQDVFDTLINMTRQPVMVGLDLKCEIAANNVAKARMQEMLEQYGPQLITSVSSEMIRHSESILKRRIQEIPDGVWTDSGAIQTDETWNVVLTLRKKGDRLIFDFTGSDQQAKRGINLPYHATFGTCFEAVLTTLGYDLPRNHGAFGPIEVIAPEGTVVNVQYPGPVSLNTTSGMKTVQYLSSSVLMQMLATSEKWQREVMALSLGFRLARHAGVNQYGRYYVSTLLDLSGAGATSYRDGMYTGGYLTAHNVEWIESNFPLFYLFRRHIKDGGGAGEFVGGSGAEAALALHDAPEGRIKVIAFGVAGLRNSGQGIFGGYPAAPSLLVLLEESKVRDFIERRKYPKDLADLGGQRKLLPYCEIDLKPDGVLYIRSASGGGYGDPLERDPKLVAEDFRNGLISKETAEEIYGVMLDEYSIVPDLAATQALRLRLRQERSA